MKGFIRRLVLTSRVEESEEEETDETCCDTWSVGHLRERERETKMKREKERQ